jgi:hypothetical protein
VIGLGVTTKDRVTALAARNDESPDCSATSSQVPIDTMVTVVPETLHTLVSFEVSATDKPEPDETVTENGDVPYSFEEIAAKVIVCADRWGMMAAEGAEELESPPRFVATTVNV